VSKQLRLLGLAILAIFAISAIATATASAESPELLPVKEGRKFNSKNETGSTAVLLATAGGEIRCTEATNKGEFTGPTLGNVELDFHGCTTNKGTTKCNSLGDSAELILIPGAGFHLVDVLLSNVLHLGILILLPALLVHLECGMLLILVLGDVIGEANGLKSLEKASKATFLFTPEKSGVQGERFCMEPKAVCEPGGIATEFLLKSVFKKSEELASEEVNDIVEFLNAKNEPEEVEIHF